jgi:hypothetical protein
LEQSAGLTPRDAVYVRIFGDSFIQDGTWPILGRTAQFSPEIWPIPIFRTLRARSAARIYYDSLRSAGQETVASFAEVEGLPDDGVSTAAAIEMHLDEILEMDQDEMLPSGNSAASNRMLPSSRIVEAARPAPSAYDASLGPASSLELDSEMPEHSVQIFVRLSDERNGAAPEREKIFELQESIRDLLEEAEVGELDGDEWGEGFCQIFLYGSAADRILAAIENPVREFKAPRGSYIVVRKGPPGTEERRIDL